MNTMAAVKYPKNVKCAFICWLLINDTLMLHKVIDKEHLTILMDITHTDIKVHVDVYFDD